MRDPSTTYTGLNAIRASLVLMRPLGGGTDRARAKIEGEIVHLDHGVAQGVSALDHGVFLVGQAAGRIGGVGDVAHVGLRIAVQRAALFQLADLGLDGFGLQRGGQRQFDGAYRLVGGGGQVAAGGQAITGGARLISSLATCWPSSSEGSDCGWPQGKTMRRRPQATKRFG